MEKMKQHIQYNFLKDGHFAELKKAELMEDKINQLGNIESYIGTFFSKEWVQKNVLNMNDAQIKEMQNQINKAGTEIEDGGIDIPPDSDGITRYWQMMTMEEIMSSEDFVNQLQQGNNLGAKMRLNLQCKIKLQMH